MQYVRDTMKRIYALIGLLVVAATLPLSADQVYSKNNKANKLYKQGKYEDALKMYNDLMVQAPQEPGIKCNAGSALYKLGAYDKAAEAYSNTGVIKNKQAQADVYYNLANTQFRQAQQMADTGNQEGSMEVYKSALENYAKALDMRPNDKDTKWNAQVTAGRIKDLQKQQQNQKKNNKNNKNDKNKQNQNKNKNDQNKQNDKNNQNDKNKQDQNKNDKNKNDQNKQNQNNNNKNQNNNDKQNQNSNNKQNQDNKKNNSGNKPGNQPPQQTPQQQKLQEAKKDAAQQMLQMYGDDDKKLQHKPDKKVGVMGSRKSDKDW